MRLNLPNISLITIRNLILILISLKLKNLMPQIIVIGGGIIGMSQAFKLLQKGFNVKLVERNSGVA